MDQNKYRIWKKDGHYVDIVACSRVEAVDIAVNNKAVKKSEIAHLGRAVYGARNFEYPFRNKDVNA